LFPENMHHILCQLADLTSLISTSTPPPVDTISTPFFLFGSPPEPAILRSKNQAFLSTPTIFELSTDYKTHAAIEWHVRAIANRGDNLAKGIEGGKGGSCEMKGKRIWKAFYPQGQINFINGGSTDRIERSGKERWGKEPEERERKDEKRGRKRKAISSESEDEDIFNDDISVRELLELEHVEISECIEVAL
jgi:hypothetical protein